jgi:hypothetical protein
VQLAILAFVAVLFLVSPNLLFLLGVGYSSPTGSQLEKVHPALYLAVVLLAIALLSRLPRPNFLARAQGAAYWLAAAAISSLLLFAAVSVESGGGELSGLLVTYLLPALAVLVLGYADEATLKRLPGVIGVFFLVNSTTGLVESASGARLLPFVAGDALLTFDYRPTAVLGHPLSNAMLTGGWLLIQMMAGFRNGYRPSLLAVCGYHMLAMLAFGGRASLVLMVVIFFVYVLYRVLARLSVGQGTQEVLRALAIAALASLTVPIVIWSGAADAIIGRFLDSQGSDETRLAALQILASLEPMQWWTGVPVSIRAALQASAGSEYGIELSWVALVVTFGLPIAAILLIAMFNLLRAVGRRSGAEGLLLSTYFIAATFTSLSIASKSLLLAQFLVLLICVPRRQMGQGLSNVSGQGSRPALGPWGTAATS